MKSLLTLPKDYIRPEWRTCAVPGRPWWQIRPGRAYASRLDGAFGHPHGFPSKTWLDSEYEAHDVQDPLDHPGYRVGQIWAITFDAEFEGLIQLDMEDAAKLCHSTNEPEVWQRICSRLRLAVWDSFGMPYGTLHMALLHDPVRPDLAPWSSL